MTVNIKNWQELKKPNNLEIKPGNDPKRRVTFVAEPLERGFGLTLGNALRRAALQRRGHRPHLVIGQVAHVTEGVQRPAEAGAAGASGGDLDERQAVDPGLAGGLAQAV